MVGLGTIFIAVMVLAAFLLWRGKLYRIALMLWILMLSVPFPYIANTAGWMTAEAGPPALADLRPDAHRARHFAARFRGQCLVHAARFHGHVRVARDSVPVSDLARN